MKIKKVISLLCTAAMLLAVPAGNVYAGAEDQSVVVTMPTTSEPESGFDPAYRSPPLFRHTEPAPYRRSSVQVQDYGR